MGIKKLYRILWVFLGLAFPACNAELEEEIAWELDEYPDMLVVEGTVTNTLVHQELYLTVTGPYLSADLPETVSAARVTVSDGTNTFPYSESGTIKGKYESDSAFKGVPLNTYTLNISLDSPVNGFTHYTAESKMPDGLELDSIICEIYSMPDLGFGAGDEDTDSTLLGIYYYGKEPDDPDNYYVARISGNNVPWQVNAKELIRFNDDYNNGGQSDFILILKNTIPGDTIAFEVNSVERHYYDYIGSIQSIDQTGSAYSMSGPPANAVGNIPGALGYFKAIYVSAKTGIAVDRRE